MRDFAASAAAPAAICKTVRRGSFKAFPKGGPAGTDYHAVVDTRNNSACRRASLQRPRVRESPPGVSRRRSQQLLHLGPWIGREILKRRPILLGHAVEDCRLDRGPRAHTRP